MDFLITYLVYIAVIARAIGWNYETTPIPTHIWILMAIFGAILISQQALTRRFPIYPRIYILLQSGLVITMLYTTPTIDFLTMLFLPIWFQAVQFFPNWIGFTWIGICVLAIGGMILKGLEWEAGLTSLLTSSGTGLLMGSFAYLIARTEQRRQQNQHLFSDLQEAHQQLRNSAVQSEELAAATERHHLVRELHDSLTQTLFSMNLAVQSAQLSLGDDLSQAEEHIIRLQTLAHSAGSEVQDLLGRAPHWSLARGGLVAAIHQLARERLSQDGLQVTFEVTGQRDLPELVDENLFRIAQEALNNVTRHAGVSQVLVRLCLDSPIASLEIIDQGRGFYMEVARKEHQFGLHGMAERAREIGWELEIKSIPGQGTHIHVQERGR